MRIKWVPLIMLLCVAPTHAVVVTCVHEGNGVVRLDYSATDETVLPAAFTLDLTVDGGAIIQSIYDYRTGDSTAANRGFGIFPASLQFNAQGLVSDWGAPDMNPSKSTGVQPGLGTAGVTIGMATRYDGSANAPSATGTLCRIRVDPRGAPVVNVKVAANAFGGGVVLADATTAQFTGNGTTLGTPAPTAPPAPASLSYPTASSTGAYTVRWAAVTAATSYELERSADAGTTWTAAYAGGAASYAESVGNGSYRYRVRATNSAGSSAWTTGATSCVVSLSTPPTVPQPPASITYPATSSTGTYTVSWPASTGATSYQLERSANSGSTWTSAYSGTAVSSAETVPNGSYRYRVRATNSAGSSVWTTGSGSCVVSISPPPSGTATIGNTKVFSNVSTGGNRRAVPYTMPETGVLQSISIYHQGGSGRLILGVYADNSGKPGARLEVTNTATLQTSAGWQTVTLQSPVSVPSGRKIWLAWVFERNPGIRYTTGTPGRAEAGASWAGGMPATFGASNVANNIYSIYANYSKESSGGTAKTLGNTQVFSSVSTGGNRRAVPYTMTETGVLQSISIYHQSGSGRMILAVYADNSGKPGARLGVTDATTVQASTGWQTVALQTPVSVPSGRKIWLAWVFEKNPGIRYTTGTPGRAEAGASWAGGMPATFGASNVANNIYSIYATYTFDVQEQEHDD